MSQLPRQIQLPLVGTILFCLLVGVYLLASKHFPKRKSSTKIVKHSVKTPADEALKYWTVDKMRTAKPVTLPNVDEIRPGKQQPRQPPHTSHP